MKAKISPAAAKGREVIGANVVPKNYKLNFIPDMKRFTFEGEEHIEAEVRKPSRTITLNANELEIKRALVSSKGKELSAKVKYQKQLERVQLILSGAVSGDVTIHIKYSGTNNDRMYGFYRSTYKLPSGKTRTMLTSQFEAVDARAAFPCIDEPAMKATFEVSFEIDPELEAISNMPVLRSSSNGRKKRVAFMKTPRMAPYLLYLCVGKFDRLSTDYRGIKISVISTPGNRKYSKLPLSYAKTFLQFYEKYFGIRYPLPKMDLLAIPDFAAGAMENWGAVTFREVDILCDESSPLRVKQSVAITIAHEFAHQWFGDLATMAWWNDLWLNESFATMMSYKAVGSAFPEWDVDKKYLEDNFREALFADQLHNTHPISVKVNKPGEIDEIFDEISYEKGGSVLKMLEDYIGEEAFRKGVSAYLKEHSYSNGEGRELWTSLSRQAPGKGVDRLAENWLTTPGFPVVTVKASKDGFQLTQQAYKISKSDNPGNLWRIPIHYKLSGGREGRILMDAKTASIKGHADWIKLNYGQRGLYRVIYDREMVSRLGEACRSGKLGDVDAWGLEEDLFSLMRTGRMTLNEYVAYVSKHFIGLGYPLNMSLILNFNWIYSISYDKTFGSAMRNTKFRIAKSILDEYGFEHRKGEDATVPLLRSAAISSLGIAGYAPVVERCRKLIGSPRLGRELSDIRSAVYSTYAWNGGAKEAEKLRSMYLSSKTSQEKHEILVAMSIHKQPELELKTLDFSMSGKVRLQDKFFVPSIVGTSPAGKDVIWKWISGNWKELLEMYDQGTHMLMRIVSSLSMQSDKTTRDQIMAFFSKKENMRDDIRRTVRQTLELIDANIAFMEINGKMK